MSNVLKHYGFEFSSMSQLSPELSSAQACFKGTLVVANLLFLIFGCVLAGVGAYALNSKAGALAGQTLPQGIIVLGVFIMLVSFLGCTAAYKESRFFLGVYFVLLMLFVIILLCVGIAVYAKNDSASIYLAQGWCAANAPVRSDIQNYFFCCGLYVFNDSQLHVDNGGQTITPACPRENSGIGFYVPCPAGVSTSNGLACLDLMSSTFSHSYIAAGACAIAFAIIMAFGMVLVCILMSGIKEKRHLEDIRKLHRKLREAKENPNMSAAAMAVRDLDAGYGDVDLGGGGLDTDVNINVDQSATGNAAVAGLSAMEEGIESSVPAAVTTTSPSAHLPTSSRGKKRSPRYEEPAPPPPQPTHDDAAYDDESGYGEPQHQHDEYDE